MARPAGDEDESVYSQGLRHQTERHEDICGGAGTKHSRGLLGLLCTDGRASSAGTRIAFEVFWGAATIHDASRFAKWVMLSSNGYNRDVRMQGNDVGTQYRSGIYFYTPEQEKAARESLERHQKSLNRKIVTEILPAKKFYRAEEYHQQYLAKGGRFGFKQSAEKGCNDPIRCYG
ncbi:uncharacterized protein A4U43_C04F31770 [Asparagus officinalis]|uniref:peptide-methionine (S)-S-oxide reductase n=1 Tax=Asparagus officinalis TaxID=4686 RepID=A0A5P1F5K5_ASPOF|nr:uncharacterized protein A4U43_C04F31770 [Asparagus officinalis]